MVSIVKKLKIKKALSSNSKKPSSKHARTHAQKAKTLLHTHRARKEGYHNKVAIRVDN
jgi:hypothetical protein